MQTTAYITLGTNSSIQSNLNPTKENNRYIKKHIHAGIINFFMILIYII